MPQPSVLMSIGLMVCKGRINRSCSLYLVKAIHVWFNIGKPFVPQPSVLMSIGLMVCKERITFRDHVHIIINSNFNYS